MNYDFESFKKMYGLDDDKDENSKDILSSEFSVLDELDDCLYEELSNDLEKDLDETPTLSEIMLEESDDNLEKTMEIDTFEFDSEMAECLEPEPVKEVKTKKKKKLLPWTVAEDHHLEYAFAHCAVLGFITAAMGSGMLLYIINHMNSL